MDQYIEQIMQNADLNIEAYDVHTRREMSSLDRKMPCYVMSYMKSGSAVLEVYGERYEIEEGSIIIIPENVVHSHYKTDTKPTTFLWWHFNFKIHQTVDVLKLLNFPVVSYLKDKESFEQIFYRFYDNNRKMNKLSEVLMHRACGLELMAYLVEELFVNQNLLINSKIPEEFWKIFELINSSSTDRITLKQLGKRFAMSPTYISNRFKYYFGCSPIAMRNNVLFERAKLMLIAGDKSIGEISEESGFDSLAGFTHFFTKRAKVSPSEFRNTRQYM